MGAPNSPTRTLLESTGGQMLHRSRRNMYTEVGGPDYATEKEFPDEFEATDRTEKKDDAWAGQKIYQSTERDKGHYYLTAKGDHKSNVENRAENVRKKKEEKIGRHKKDPKDNKNDEYYYERTVEDTGKLNEKIFDGSHKQTYERTVENTGTLTEEIFDDKYKREIDSSSGNLTEEVAGELTIQSDGKMLLKTTNGDIEINAADQNRNVIIKANKRIEETKEESERMDWGFKREEAYGHVHELTGGFKDEIMLGGKFESIDAVAIGISAAAAFDWNFLFKLEGSLINILVDELVIKKHKIAKIENSGVAVTVQNAIKMVL